MVALATTLLAAGLWFAWPVRAPVLPLRAMLKGGGQHVPMAFSPDGSLLATIDGRGRVTLWDVATARPRTVLEGAGGFPIRFSPDGRHVALSYSAGTPTSEVMPVYETGTGRLVKSIETGKAGLSDARFSTDGSSLYLVLWDRPPGPPFPPTYTWEIHTWDTSTWTERPVRSVTVPQFSQGSVSPDGQLLATGHPYTPGVTLWDTATGATVATLTVSGAQPTAGTYSRVFSPDGTTLAVGKSDGTLEFWDVATRTLSRTLPGHPGHHIHSSRFAARAPETLITCAWDAKTSVFAQAVELFTNLFRLKRAFGQSTAQVAVWDLKTGRRRVLFAGMGFAVVSPDGSILATPSGGDTVNLWDFSPKRAGSPP
jgi:WD40 repeat protein